MTTGASPKVVDYIVRFCDVESQILIPMIETPLLDLFNAVIDGTLKDIELKLLSSSAVCVVVTSGGYPLEYEKGIKLATFCASELKNAREKIEKLQAKNDGTIEALETEISAGRGEE